MNSKLKICSVLSLQQNRWNRKICTFYKILQNKRLNYLYNSYKTRLRSNVFSPCLPNMNFWISSFFPFFICKWKNLAQNMEYNESNVLFFYFIWPSPNIVYKCHNLNERKPVTRPRVDLSDLQYQTIPT